ncbi:WD40-repeat-containing domain protein [Suillus occidentalis]|nr:WD40-repeat-containing domain protein [Suillus occidentalis]
MLSSSATPYTLEPIRLNGKGIHSAPISCLDFLDEDRCIITCSEDGSIQVRKTDTGQVVGNPWTDPGSGAVHAMAVSSNHMKVVTGSQDGRIRLWTVATGEMTGKWNQAHSLAILSVCWSPDELNIASGSEDGTAIIWDTKKGDIVGHPIRTAHPHVYAVRYSCDGATLLTSGYNNTITFWDVKTREALRFVEACHASQQVHCVIWTPYDKIFLGCSNGIVQARTDTQGKVARLGDRVGPICAIVLSQDNLLLATASLDNTISLWDPDTNQSVSRPLVHPSGLRCAAFARNSRLLATSGISKNVYIWDLQGLSGDVGATNSQSGPSLGTSTAGHSLIDINASVHPAGNNTRGGSRHNDTNILDGARRLPGHDMAIDIHSASPPNPKPWD